jgi:hypothetical protein
MHSPIARLLTVLSVLIAAICSPPAIADESISAKYAAHGIAMELKYKTSLKPDPSSEESLRDASIIVTKAGKILRRERILPDQAYRIVQIEGPQVQKSPKDVLDVIFHVISNRGLEDIIDITVKPRTGVTVVKHDKHLWQAWSGRSNSWSKVTCTTSDHQVRATLSYAGTPGKCERGGPTLCIERHGKKQVFTIPCPRSSDIRLFTMSALVVGNLSGNEHDVYVGISDLQTLSLVYVYDPTTQLYTEHRCTWDSYANLSNLNRDSRLELVGYDGKFVEPFLNSAVSCEGPLLIKRLVDGKFVDVTNEFPQAINKQVDDLLHECKRSPGATCDMDLAAVVADMKRLNKEDRAIDLIKSSYPSQVGADFFTKVQDQLNKSKYPVLTN